jgi:hypothetical protein
LLQQRWALPFLRSTFGLVPEEEEEEEEVLGEPVAKKGRCPDKSSGLSCQRATPFVEPS